MNFSIRTLEGIQKILMGTYEAGIPLSSHSKGFERETFISSFLSKVLPPLYRFGTGEVVDGLNEPSGQLDIVVETPFMPSLPLPGAESSPRLYPPEAVAVVIEVKSDIDTQWNRLKLASEKLGKFERRFGAVITMGELPKQIPYFAVAYKGPKKLQTLWDRLKIHPRISGVLIVESKVFLARASALGLSLDNNTSAQPEHVGCGYEGNDALWAFVIALHAAMTVLQAASANPNKYMDEPTLFTK